jgi:dienelactone hydrolase
VSDLVREELLVPIGRQEEVDFYRGRLDADSDHVEFHFLVPDSDGPRPFILLLPILAGGENLMWIVGWDLAKRGYAVAWTRRAGSAMARGQRAPEMEELFRRTVVQNRMLLDWVRHEDTVDLARMGLLGISMGGIVGGVLLALEPDLAAGALCLAGGNLPDLIMKSTESRVRRWRDWRSREDGIGSHELRRELATYLVSDPASFGAYVDTDRVFLVSALLDEVVPISNQDLLWESLGRPRRLFLPLGHYTAAIGISSILNDVEEFINERFELSAASPPGQPSPDSSPLPDPQ